MKVEIWSDVVCPFCYIGKRKFEAALAQFENKKSIQIEWKSFQLAPNQVTDPDKTLNQFLAEEKGWSLEYAKELNDQIVERAKQEGLIYHLDEAIPANTHKAHELIHFAKANGRQGEAKERLLRAYFTEGKNIDDISTLLQLGREIELDEDALKAALENGTYTNDVHGDISEAQQLGVRGVPFFAFNRKYAISGAQETDAFLETLETSFAEWRKDNPETILEVTAGQTCTPDGECD